MKQVFAFALIVPALLAITSGAEAQHAGHGAQSDSAAVAEVVLKFHAATAAGDSATVLSLLAPDATILESGGIETLDAFRSGHLRADIRSAQTSKIERGPIQVRVQGDVAWTVSNTTNQREANGNTTTSVGAELMVLVRSGPSWKISAIHWSSRRRTG